MKSFPRVSLILLTLLLFSSTASAEVKIKSLCGIHYPSDARIEWTCLKLKWTDTPSGLFGAQWPDVLRFNRMDRRHFVSGLSIKVPRRIGDIKGFNPMHFGLRIYTDKREDGWTSYWLHGRDIPGYPASHGCIGLYDEEMQKAYYHEPERPILNDARKLYSWVVGPSGDPGKFRNLRSSPRVLIMGIPPGADAVPVASTAPHLVVTPAVGKPLPRH